MYWIILIVIGIIALVGVVAYFKIKENKSKNKIKEAKNLINMLLKSNNGNFKTGLREIINELDMNNFSVISDGGNRYMAIKEYINTKFIDKSYNLILNIINESFRNKEMNRDMYIAVTETLSPEMVREYTLDLFDNLDIQDLMIDLYNKCLSEKIDQIEEEDKRINEEYWLPSESEPEIERTIEENNAIMDNYIKDHHLDDVNEYEFEIDKRLMNSYNNDEVINPPKEEESDVIEDDGSIEVIEWIGDKQS